MSRKSPTIKERKCEICGELYRPSVTTQKYCKKCGKNRERERKKEWQLAHFPPKGPKKSVAAPCCICGGAFLARIDEKPYCSKHYHSMHSHGVPELPPRNLYAFLKDGVEILTNRGNGEKIWIDREDFDSVSKYTWCYSKTGYPVSRIDGHVVKLSRYLMKPEKNMVVDHIDGDTRNNRKCNLRVCTNKENARNICRPKNNTSGFTGVRLCPSGRYSAMIMVDRKQIRIGTYDTFEEAVEARKFAELKHFGEFSPHLRLEYKASEEIAP